MTSNADTSTSQTAATTTTNGGNGNSNETVAGGSGGGCGGSSGNHQAAAETGSGSIEAEASKIPYRHGWNRFYHEIREGSDREANEKNFSTAESEKPENRGLNRYRDVSPYDHSRIILHRGSVDYINANLVKLERADRKYILTQGPLAETVAHFWVMVWEQNTKAIIMLNKLMEKKTIKCHKYWPDRKGSDKALELKDVKLSIEYLRCEQYKNYSRRWFKLTDLDSKQSREIIQFHYTTWPDFGIPSSPVAFLQFLKEVRDSGALNSDVGPAVVHCSAGIGRSGTFCLVDCCLVLVDKEGEQNVSVKDILYELRRYRMGLIQTPDQLYFSYQAIIEGIKLLKDKLFLEYNESPIICNDDAGCESHPMDETPPPLPPRTHSLLPLAGTSTSGSLTLNLHSHSQTQHKPLPNIPANSEKDKETFNNDIEHDIFAALDNNHQLSQHQNRNKDALNNFLNIEKLTDHVMLNRPLPPLPQRNIEQMAFVHDAHGSSDSDENQYFQVDDDDSDDDDIDDDDDDEEEDVNFKSAINSEKEHGLKLDAKSVYQLVSSDRTALSNSTKTEADDVCQVNGGIESNRSNNSNNLTSPDNELRRRKREERQAKLDQKVQEIKRKQRESEDDKEAAKKRRSLSKFLAAGFLVGVICVYVYVKWT